MATADEIRRLREETSIFSRLFDLARQQGESLEQEGRRPVLGGLLSKEPVMGTDTIRYEGITPLLLNLIEPIARGIDAPRAAAQNLIPQEDMISEAFGTAGTAMIGGGLAAKPSGALGANTLRSKVSSDVAERGDQILNMLKSGRADDITDSMFDMRDPVKNTQLNQYLFENYDLPMDKASRMARAREMGVSDEDLYHGSTHDFLRFGGGPRNVEGHFGAGDYFTTSPFDADKNYAGVGPDLTTRLELRAERLTDEGMDEAMAMSVAKKELMGDAPLGLIYPVNVRGSEIDVQNYTRGTPTTIEVDAPRPEDYFDKVKKELGKNADEDEIYNLAQDYADNDYEEAFYKSPLGNIANSLQRSAEKFDDVDVENALETLNEAFYDGFITADNLDKKLRNSVLYATDEQGNLVGNEIVRQAFSDAGFENIRMDASSAFGNMKNIPEGTKHIIANSPSNIRSRFARFDPRLSHLSNITAANASPISGILAQSGVSENQAQRIEDYLRKRGLLD